MNRPTHIVIHTTDSRGGDAGLIDFDHVHHRGFSMIGYHWVVLNGRQQWSGQIYDDELDGAVQSGRPEEVIGAHAPGMNARSIGVALVAHREQPVTELQLAAAARLVREVMQRYGISAERVIGHREVPGCPPEKLHCPLLDMDRFRALLRG